MGLKLRKKTKTTIPPLEADTYVGTCIGVIDLGEQHNEKFKKYEEKILLVFEIEGKYVEQDGEQKPRWLSKECTASVNEKAKLREYISAFIGRLSDDELEEFDVTALLGKSAFMEVSVEKSKSSDTVYNNIAAVTKLPKTMKPPEPESSIMLLDFDDWNEEVFNELPEWIRNKIKNSPTYQNMGKPPEKIDFDEPNGNGENETVPDKADF